MSRRRRQRNPLLMRILVVSVAAHIIILPILAHFGAFKHVQQELVKVDLIKLPSRPKPPPPPPKKQAKPKAKAKPRNTAHAVHHAAPVHAQAHHSNFTQPKVIAGSGTGAGGGGATVDNSGTGAAGQLPTKIAQKPAPIKQAAPPVKTISKPAPQKTAPPPAPMKRRHVQIAAAPPTVPAPHIPVVLAAKPALPAASEPQPDIPDSLRFEAMNSTCVVEVTIDAGGMPADAHILQSSGSSRLDKRAEEAVLKWKFLPATSDGQPIVSQVRVHIHFEVN